MDTSLSRTNIVPLYRRSFLFPSQRNQACCHSLNNELLGLGAVLVLPPALILFTSLLLALSLSPALALFCSLRAIYLPDSHGIRTSIPETRSYPRDKPTSQRKRTAISAAATTWRNVKPTPVSPQDPKQTSNQWFPKRRMIGAISYATNGSFCPSDCTIIGPCALGSTESTTSWASQWTQADFIPLYAS